MHTARVKDERMTLRDGRTLAWCEYGPANGTPVLRFQGTPGSRKARHPHEDSYERLRARVFNFDRPGYGASTRKPGRGFSIVADDAVELLDHLGLEAVHVIGQSGGGPHVLAFASTHPERTRAATVVVGAAPLEVEDVADLIGLNRDAYFAAREGFDALHALLVPVREALLKDPLGGFRDVMKDAPPEDQDVMSDPDWQRVFVEDLREALAPNAEGWTDEGIALMSPFDFDPADARASIVWWHGEHDANAPLSAVRRLVRQIPSVDLRTWQAGHLESYRRHNEILAELLAR
jgi:pimeloyl-ACP methyl ester carboxylesterase